jgi:hypothetical protein
MPPAAAFFERAVELPALSESEAAELLDRRQLWPAGWSAQLAHAVGGHPRRLLAAARDLLDQPDELDAALVRLNQRDDAITALGRPATMVAAELASLGAASASDEALLTRLGWTRARASQVLAQLADAGLVRSTEQKQGQGRPKRVFRLALPTEYPPS